MLTECVRLGRSRALPGGCMAKLRLIRSFCRDELFKHLPLLNQRSHFVFRIAPCFQQNPAFVLNLAEQLKQLSPGIVGPSQFPDVCGLPKTAADEIEIVFESLTFQVFCVGIPADGDIRVIRNIENGLHDRQFTGSGPVHFHTDLLAILGPVGTDFIECPANLFNRLLTRNTRNKAVGLHLDARTTAVMHQLHITFCQFDIGLQLFGIGFMKLGIGTIADQGDGRILEATADVLPLLLRERRFNTMSMLRPQLNSTLG